MAHIANDRLLASNFNSRLKHALLIFGDEAFYTGDKKHEGIANFMVTQEYLAIEFKGKDVIFVKNHIRLLVSPNNNWAVPTGLEERRFCVLDIGTKKVQNTKKFTAICEQIDNGGREALLYGLLHYDLAGANLKDFPHLGHDNFESLPQGL